MRKLTGQLATGILLCLAAGVLAGPPVQASPPVPPSSPGNLPGLRQQARQRTDHVFVILVEFGTERHPKFPDRDTNRKTPGPERFDGPLHNQIRRPDRATDNATVWRPDFSAAYYRRLYFGTGPGIESLRTYYEMQSSGRYSLRGQVTDWVKVRYNEARYGRSGGYPCAKNVCSDTWALVTDALNQWVADQKKRGLTDAQIKAELAPYDQWDRYDHDHDGNHDEPDGYIDHFQIVHAGEDEADMDPTQGEDAIWSHRWKAYSNLEGQAGPPGNRDGGVQIGHTGLWVGDYTIQPENGGLSVVAHEFGHDLGLPDDYDVSGGKGDSPMEWWSLMAQSRLSRPGEGVATRLGDLGAWEKLQLGWLDYEIVPAGQNRTLTLGPEEYTTANPQAVLIVLPKKHVVTRLPRPAVGTHQWWSSEGDDVDATLTRRVRLPRGPARLTFRANWDVEDCGSDPCDYAFVEVDDGHGWKPIPGSFTHPAEHNGIDGKSHGWKPATFDLSRFAGHAIGLRFRYATDAASGGQGFFVDEIALTAAGRTLFHGGAEGTSEGWVTAGGFRRASNTFAADKDRYYLIDYRSGLSYDRYLRKGPYNFGWLDTHPNLTERFSYEPGLLVTYWDTSQRDNDVSKHPGRGRNLTVDAHPRPIYRIDGPPWRTRVQLYDAPFGLKRPDSFTLHVNGRASYLRGQPAAPVFDDKAQYWYSASPLSGVKLPKIGVRVTVLAQRRSRMVVRLSSDPAPVRRATRPGRAAAHDGVRFPGAR